MIVEKQFLWERKINFHINILCNTLSHDEISVANRHRSNDPGSQATNLLDLSSQYGMYLAVCNRYLAGDFCVTMPKSVGCFGWCTHRTAAYIC